MFATSLLNIHNTSANQLAATQRMTNYKEDYLTISYSLIELTKLPIKLNYLSSPNIIELLRAFFFSPFFFFFRSRLKSNSTGRRFLLTCALLKFVLIKFQFKLNFSFKFSTLKHLQILVQSHPYTFSGLSFSLRFHAQQK